MDDLEQDLNKIDWTPFRTAYGNAAGVPELIRQLWSSEEIALRATHDLWCALCHQHVFVSSAALPAFPFLLQVLRVRSDALKVEILDIFVGFAISTTVNRVEEHWQHLLYLELRANSALFQELAAHPNSDIAEFATRILEELRNEESRPPKVLN